MLLFYHILHFVSSYGLNHKTLENSGRKSSYQGLVKYNQFT